LPFAKSYLFIIASHLLIYRYGSYEFTFCSNANVIYTEILYPDIISLRNMHWLRY